MAVSDQTRSGDLAETFKSERETIKTRSVSPCLALFSHSILMR